MVRESLWCSAALVGGDVVAALIEASSERLGLVYEEAFCDCLRLRAARGDFGPRIVAVGLWWKRDGQDEIDAVVLAEPARTQVPVVVGEAKWAAHVNATSIVPVLMRKAMNPCARCRGTYLRYLCSGRGHPRARSGARSHCGGHLPQPGEHAVLPECGSATCGLDYPELLVR